jgi:hypothetical protein
MWERRGGYERVEVRRGEVRKWTDVPSQKLAFSGFCPSLILTLRERIFRCDHMYELHIEALTISGWEPLTMTGRICWKSPPKTTVRPPKGMSESQISLQV